MVQLLLELSDKFVGLVQYLLVSDSFLSSSQWVQSYGPGKRLICNCQVAHSSSLFLSSFSLLIFLVFYRVASLAFSLQTLSASCGVALSGSAWRYCECAGFLFRGVRWTAQGRVDRRIRLTHGYRNLNVIISHFEYFK